MNNNVIRFTHPRKAREDMQEQACDWLARLDAGATPEDLERLSAWLDENPAHTAMLLEMAELWDQVDVLAELSEIFPLAQYAPAQQQLRHKGLIALAAGMIATLLLAVAYALVEQRQSLDAAEQARTIAAAPRVYETAIGQQLTARLPDGSTVILNTNTRIELGFTNGVRNVYLIRGEGHFEVSKNANWPFRVHAGQRVIEAVGTAFAVQHLEADSVAVTVTEGSVNLSRDANKLPAVAETAAPAPASQPDSSVADSIPLVAGDYAAIDEQLDSIERKQMQQEEIEVELSWRHGMLLFQDDPLSEVLLEVSRYTPIQIEMDDAIRDTKVKGYYRAGDVEAMLVALETNFNLEVERLGADRIRLRSKP